MRLIFFEDVQVHTLACICIVNFKVAIYATWALILTLSLKCYSSTIQARYGWNIVVRQRRMLKWRHGSANAHFDYIFPNINFQVKLWSLLAPLYHSRLYFVSLSFYQNLNRSVCIEISNGTRKCNWYSALTRYITFSVTKRRYISSTCTSLVGTKID